MGKKRNEYRFLMGKLEGKRPVGRPRLRWEDIKMYVTSMYWGSVDWINLAQVRQRWHAVVNTVVNVRVP
jgi:hypothetical protein